MDTFAIRDLDLAELGRKKIRMAEKEMPGLMSLRAEYAHKAPLKGARIAGCLHMTIETAALDVLALHPMAGPQRPALQLAVGVDRRDARHSSPATPRSPALSLQ